MNVMALADTIDTAGRVQSIETKRRSKARFIYAIRHYPFLDDDLFPIGGHCAWPADPQQCKRWAVRCLQSERAKQPLLFQGDISIAFGIELQVKSLLLEVLYKAGLYL